MVRHPGVRRWWAEECGGREILRLALPLVVSTGFFSITLFIDRMFLLWYSSHAMAASMSAGMLHWSMLCFPLGLAQYANTFVAQYHGAGRPERIGPAVWQSARVGVYATPLFVATIPLAPWVFLWFGHDEPVRGLETAYFQWLVLGAPPAVICGALASFFTGRGETRVVMYVNCLTTCVNIGLDYLWIFGRAGFPPGGIVGAALATSIAQWTQMAVYLALMFRGDQAVRYALHRWRFDAALFQRMLFYGSPNGLQHFVEAGAFTLVTLKLGQLGSQAMAATTLAFNVNAVAFIPLIGVSIAVSTLVGHHLPQGRSDLATRATWSGVFWALAYSVLFGACYLFAPHVLMAGHAAGSNAEEFLEIRDMATVLLRFVAAYCLFDAVQIVFVGAIKGAGDTWFVLASTFVLACSALSIGWLGDVLHGGGLYWWWMVITCWVFSMGVVFGSRFLQGRWKTMRVIEPVAVEAN